MHKLYRAIQSKIEGMQITAAANVPGQNSFWAHLELAVGEILFGVVKLAIILTHDSGTVFKIFYQTDDFKPCFYRYRSFKVVHKRVRTFSYAMMIIAVSATTATNFLR